MHFSNKHFTFLLFWGFFLIAGNTLAQNTAYQRIELMLRSNQPKDALQVLDSLEKAGTVSSLHKIYKINGLISLQRNVEAIRFCTDEIGKTRSGDSLLPELYFLRSLANEQGGNRPQAIRDIEKAIRLKPREIKHYLNASYYYGESGDYKNCLETLEKALKLEHDNFYVLNNLSYYSTLSGRYEKGLEYAERGLKLVNDNSSMGILLNNRGFARLGMKNIKGAQDDINDAIRLYPENGYAYFNKALLCIAQGNDGMACENLNMAVLYGYNRPLDAMISKHCK